MSLYRVEFECNTPGVDEHHPEHLTRYVNMQLAEDEELQRIAVYLASENSQRPSWYQVTSFDVVQAIYLPRYFSPLIPTDENDETHYRVVVPPKNYYWRGMPGH